MYGNRKMLKRKTVAKRTRMRKQGTSDRTNERQGMEIKGLRRKIKMLRGGGSSGLRYTKHTARSRK